MLESMLEEQENYIKANGTLIQDLTPLMELIGLLFQFAIPHIPQTKLIVLALKSGILMIFIIVMLRFRKEENYTEPDGGIREPTQPLVVFGN